MSTTLHFPVDLYSEDQLTAVILEVGNYISVLRDAAVRSKTVKVPDEPPHVSALLMGLFHNSGLKLGSKAAAEAVQAALREIRDEAPLVHITLPALPSRTLKRQFTVWFRAEIHPYTLMTFAVRPDLGGGFIMQAGSHVYDFSFRTPLMNNRARISGLAQNV